MPRAGRCIVLGLSATGEAAFKQAIVDAGGIPAILAGMTTHAESADVQARQHLNCMLHLTCELHAAPDL